MRFFYSVLALCLLATAGVAQTKNPASSVVKEMLPRQTKNIEAAVDLMPADKFSYRPTEGQMTF